MHSQLILSSIASGLLRLFGALPLRVNHAIGALIGTIAWIKNGRSRKVTLHNLSLCFPNHTDEEREKLARQSLQETGKSLTELGWLWHSKPELIQSKIIEVRGKAFLEHARRQNTGLIVLSPHIGSWEFCIVEISKERDPLFYYRPPRQSAIEPALLKGRTRFGARLAPLTTKGMKLVMQTLRNGGTVGILPDQEPDRNSGVFAPFFGVPANTITLVNRLAAKSGAAVVFTMAERLPKGRGFRIHFLPSSELISSDDKLIAATALNSDIERCIETLPNQYMWSYKRFRLLEDGSRRPYP